MTKQKRTFVLLLAAALCFAMLFSAFFIGKEAHHDCTGADCVICDCIQICENTLRTVGVAIAIVVLLTAVISVSSSVRETFFCCAEFVTLISLKVKLSN